MQLNRSPKVANTQAEMFPSFGEHLDAWNMQGMMMNIWKETSASKKTNLVLVLVCQAKWTRCSGNFKGKVLLRQESYRCVLLSFKKRVVWTILRCQGWLYAVELICLFYFTLKHTSCFQSNGTIYREQKQLADNSSTTQNENYCISVCIFPCLLSCNLSVISSPMGLNLAASNRILC